MAPPSIVLMEGISTELRELLAIGAKSLTAAQAKDVAKD